MGTWTVGQFVVAQKTSVVVVQVIAGCEDERRGLRREIGGRTVGRERIGGGGGSGFVSHPILVIPSFLTVG